MPRVTYIGPHDGVDLVGVGTVARGETAEVSASVASNLAGREDWQIDPPAKKAAGKPRNQRTTQKEG